MFKTVLIANRGEIACRIMATARKLGIRTIAVYSDADADARHVHLADAAYRVGAAPAAESYLRIEALLDAAERSGADVIHPGYGFLSEDSEFAQACLDGGFAFVGPSPEAIRLMGNKDEAKRLMVGAGVPVVPGCDDLNIDLKVILAEARQIGYPVMIKAAAGGGGRGMRIVGNELELQDGLNSARREAMAAFGGDRLLLEKVVSDPRHIEVQIFADQYNNVVHMFERDCSIQRRYQKVVEEAPGPMVSTELRQNLTETALIAAREINYVGAGTVEFVVDRQDNFYFLEMNTRIQVEHRVTEMLIRQDLVEWQFRIAAGELLPMTQDQISIDGHAIEARLYAENPARKFMPSPGVVTHLRFPKNKPGLCVDSALTAGDEVTPYYDPLIAKIIVWGIDRNAALDSLQRALNDVQVSGVDTNLNLLSQIVRHEQFIAGEHDTSFIERYGEQLITSPKPASELVLALAALYLLLEREREAVAVASHTDDPYSPWAMNDSWRLNQPAKDMIQFVEGDCVVDVGVMVDEGQYTLDLSNGAILVNGRLRGEHDVDAVLGGMQIRGTVVRVEDELNVWLHDAAHRLRIHNALSVTDTHQAHGGDLISPMPGRITRVTVEAGDDVRRGASLMVLESMKMEHQITAPSPGRVERLNFSVGDWVDEGAVLLDFAAVE